MLAWLPQSTVPTTIWWMDPSVMPPTVIAGLPMFAHTSEHVPLVYEGDLHHRLPRCRLSIGVALHKKTPRKSNRADLDVCCIHARCVCPWWKNKEAKQGDEQESRQQQTSGHMYQQHRVDWTAHPQIAESCRGICAPWTYVLLCSSQLPNSKLGYHFRGVVLYDGSACDQRQAIAAPWAFAPLFQPLQLANSRGFPTSVAERLVMLLLVNGDGRFSRNSEPFSQLNKKGFPPQTRWGSTLGSERSARPWAPCTVPGGSSRSAGAARSAAAAGSGRAWRNQPARPRGREREGSAGVAATAGRGTQGRRKKNESGEGKKAKSELHREGAGEAPPLTVYHTRYHPPVISCVVYGRVVRAVHTDPVSRHFVLQLLHCTALHLRRRLGRRHSKSADRESRRDSYRTTRSLPEKPNPFYACAWYAAAR